MNVVSIDICDELMLLLNNNYVEGKTDNYKYIYTKEFIQWYLEIYPSAIMGIYDNNILIAMITGRIVPTIINLTNVSCVIPKLLATHFAPNTHINLAEISFMCVHKDYRNMKLCPLLISSIEKKMREMGADEAIFSTHHNMGKPLCGKNHVGINHMGINHIGINHVGINHMIRVINIRKLVSVGYLRCDTSIEKLEYHYRIENVKIKNKRLERITVDNIIDAYDVYNKWYQQMDIYTNYTLDVFKKVILSDNIIGYILYDKDVAVDIITYYIVSSNVTRRNVSMCDAYIYHYTDNSNSMHRMMSLLLQNEKDKIDTIMIPNTMGLDKNDFEDLKFVPTTSDYNYYLFINKEIVIPKNKMGVMLI
jgi:glycylpeptide N-tetradecanoyltransferase